MYLVYPSGDSSQNSNRTIHDEDNNLNLYIYPDDEDEAPEVEIVTDIPPLSSDDEVESDTEEGEVVLPLFSDDEDEETDDSIHLSDLDISSVDSGYDAMSDEDKEEFEYGDHDNVSLRSSLIQQFAGHVGVLAGIQLLFLRD